MGSASIGVGHDLFQTSLCGIIARSFGFQLGFYVLGHLQDASIIQAKSIRALCYDLVFVESGLSNNDVELFVRHVIKNRGVCRKYKRLAS
jgi:hypothetical protein